MNLVMSICPKILSWRTLPASQNFRTIPFPSFSTRAEPISKKVSLLQRYLQSGSWSEKELLSEYLKERTANLNAYVNGLPRLPSEEAFLQEIRKGYLSRKNYQDVYPYQVRLDHNTKTRENSGINFLSEEEVRFYMENGLIGPVPINSITDQTLEAVFKRFSGIPGDLTPQQYRDVRVRQEWQNKDILEMACNPEVVSRISSLLGENIIVRFTAIHEIAPHVGSFSSLTENKVPELCAHSDTNLGARITKRGLEGAVVGLDSINVWISINGTDAENGPLYMFPKTHNWSVLTPMKYLEHSNGDPEVLRLLSISGFGNEMIANHALSFNYLQTSEHQAELPKIKRVEIYTKPKECLIFSTHLLHGSDVNRTSESRLAISIRYSRATTAENEDNLKAVTSMFSQEELKRLGLKEGETKNPIIQVLGNECHPLSKPINLPELHNILEEKRK